MSGDRAADTTGQWMVVWRSAVWGTRVNEPHCCSRQVYIGMSHLLEVLRSDSRQVEGGGTAQQGQDEQHRQSLLCPHPVNVAIGNSHTQICTYIYNNRLGLISQVWARQPPSHTFRRGVVSMCAQSSSASEHLFNHKHPIALQKSTGNFIIVAAVPMSHCVCSRVQHKTSRYSTRGTPCTQHLVHSMAWRLPSTLLRLLTVKCMLCNVFAVQMRRCMMSSFVCLVCQVAS
jgi:hypothetical protein